MDVTIATAGAALALMAASAAISALLIVLLKPLMQRYALARPNARSSHTMPTPQGGGIAVVAAVVGIALATRGWSSDAGLPDGRLYVVLIVLVVLAALGTADDIRPLPVLPRLAVQFACAGALVAALPPGAAALGALGIPRPVEWAILVVGLVWFVNLTNFMDGIDGITVAEAVPVSAALAILALAGLLPERIGILALALAGALLGFYPFNRHVARLFLGDVGSLPVGALLGFMLIVLAAAGHLAAALILPLYYLADATLTLYRRWRRGERLSEAHRSHFYQLAIQRGWRVPEVTARVLALNVLLAALAGASVAAGSTAIGALALVLAGLATALVLRGFARGRHRPASAPAAAPTGQPAP